MGIFFRAVLMTFMLASGVTFSGAARAEGAAGTGTLEPRDASADDGSPPSTPTQDDRAAAIRLAIQALRPAMRRCYKEAVARNPNLEGQIELKLVLGPDGAVTRVSTGSVEATIAPMVPCLEAAAQGLRLPADGTSTARLVTVPLTFVSNRDSEPSAAASLPSTPSGATPSVSGGRGAANGATMARRLGHSLGPRLRFDLNVEGALGALADGARLSGFGRVRAGLLFTHESGTDPEASPIFLMAGATYEASDLSPVTLGLQSEIVHVKSGFWGQLGALVDVTRPEPGWTAGFGWSLFGAELQRRRYEHEDGTLRSDFAFYGKVRVPV
ncbi:MAG: AgmX/PglI C-terminal domain-containing protein, partial [Deltaproteobacteria bacterium]|nr:AgmX/PglI C-terminal domain-containing protein [Deltaproteobacteria bacterium]